MGDRHAIRSRRVAAGPGSEGKMGQFVEQNESGKAVRARLLRVGVEGTRGAENQPIFWCSAITKKGHANSKTVKNRLAKGVEVPVKSFPVKPGSMETP